MEFVSPAVGSAAEAEQQRFVSCSNQRGTLSDLSYTKSQTKPPNGTEGKRFLNCCKGEGSSEKALKCQSFALSPPDKLQETAETLLGCRQCDPCPNVDQPLVKEPFAASLQPSGRKHRALQCVTLLPALHALPEPPAACGLSSCAVVMGKLPETIFATSWARDIRSCLCEMGSDCSRGANLHGRAG